MANPGEEANLPRDEAVHQSIPYHYEPLGEQEHTRLLHMDLIEDGDIKCTFRSVSAESLGKQTNFFAMSYAWGTASPDQEIWIDGRAFKVTSHLLAGLRAVYNFLSEIGQLERWIWVRRHMHQPKRLGREVVASPTHGLHLSRGEPGAYLAW